jgi:hypothetical protein
MANKTFTQFRVDNVVTTLPTTLAYGQEVYYKDANGNLTLWVGHEDGSAWPSVGYKECVLTIHANSAAITSIEVVRDNTGMNWESTFYNDGAMTLSQENPESEKKINVIANCADFSDGAALACSGRSTYTGTLNRVEIFNQISANESYQYSIIIQVGKEA